VAFVTESHREWSLVIDSAKDFMSVGFARLFFVGLVDEERKIGFDQLAKAQSRRKPTGQESAPIRFSDEPEIDRLIPASRRLSSVSGKCSKSVPQPLSAANPGQA
jgi:hypothetical protein